MNGFSVAFAILGLAGLVYAVRRKPQVKPLDEASRAEVERLALAGKHIEALKAYRKATNASLKDAKAAVEQLERR